MLSCVQKKEYIKRNASEGYFHPTFPGDTLPRSIYYYTLFNAETDSGFHFKYCVDSTFRFGNLETEDRMNCDQYLITKKESNGLEFRTPRGGTFRRKDSLIYVADHYKIFTLKDKTYNVYRFELMNPMIDGREIRFWSPEVGFILWKSLDWYDESKLISLDGYTREDLAQLIQLVKNDTLFFRRGK